MDLFAIICSRCGSTIQVDKEQTEGKCPYCETEYVAEKPKSININTNISNTVYQNAEKEKCFKEINVNVNSNIKTLLGSANAIIEIIVDKEVVGRVNGQKSTPIAIDVNSDHFIQCTAKLFGQTAKSNILFLHKNSELDELFIDVHNEKLSYKIEISKEQKEPEPVAEKPKKEKESKKNSFSLLESVKKTYKNITKK